jgi:hypothetical protein
MILAVDLSTALTADLAQLTVALDAGARRRGDLSRCLRSIGANAERVVGSFVGLSVTLTTDGQDVTLTSVADQVEPADIHSWLRLPLSSISPGLNGSVTLYATRADAFVELARAFRATAHPRRPEMVVGAGLPPGASAQTLVSGIVGAEEISTVNRVVGLLLGRGLTPEEARAHLFEQAAREAVPVAVLAARWLQPASPAGPSRPGPASEVSE